MVLTTAPTSPFGYLSYGPYSPTYLNAKQVPLVPALQMELPTTISTSYRAPNTYLPTRGYNPSCNKLGDLST